MKKNSLIFSTIIILLVLLSCSKDDQDFIVGQESLTIEEIFKTKMVDASGKEVTTASLKTLWENKLKEEGFNVKLNTFSIIQTVDEQDNELFFLKTISKDGTIETGAFLSFDSQSNLYKLGSKQCTCTGCPNGCHLEVEGSTCTCSGCPEDTSKKCTKSETAIIEDP
ncbi:hypothetical protein [Mangrovimonas cancribranchiae]|uniref:Uncharacterized protein n=1 Tax=Mangrovimonas cancribranchiae TaxID=3080055 RepID=A0AAU6P182_9FLAO